MSSPGSTYLGLLENQIDEFRTSRTPGPLSIAFFFLGFILINHSIRMFFPSGPEDRQLAMSGLSRGERKMDGQDAKEQEEEEEDDDGTGSKDLMRMMLLKTTSPSHRPRLSPSRFESEAIARSPLADPFSTSSPSARPMTPADAHRDSLQHYRPSGPQAGARHYQEISDSCSSSTTSA